MKAEYAETSFREFLKARELEVVKLSPEKGLDATIAFYRNIRAEDGLIEDDGDMLLYQWGTYDWGNGEQFELNFTRQFILNDESVDEGIWQLALTFKYPSSEKLSGLSSGNRWCETVENLDSFEQFIRESEPFRIVLEETPVSVELKHGVAG